jgi:hypothetical protein
MIKNLARTAAAALMAVPFFSIAEGAPTADEVAKELANPNTPLASLNFKNQFRWFDGSLPGASGQSSFTTLFQPSLPFPVAGGDLILFRPAIPFIWDQPIPTATGYDSESGIGDIAFDLAYARTSEAGILTAFGLISTVPTASSDALGSGLWSIGPEVLIGKLTDKYVVGIFPNHQWDVAGWGEGSVNLTSVQLFVTLLPGGGWNVGTSPIMSYNWNNDQWAIPLNLSFGKTVILGETPWKLSAEINYYVERNDTFAPEWMVGINFAPVVKNALADWFK